MARIETVIFDLGGVLIDWNPNYVYRDIYPDPIERAWFFEHVCTHEWNIQQDAGTPLAQATEEKVAEFPEYEQQIRAFYGRWEEMLGGPIDDSVEILRTIKDKNSRRLLALTNWSYETFPVALERYDFLQWFEGIVVSGIEKVIKPQREIYELLLERYQVNPATAVFIDDSQRNVLGAQEVGIHGIHFQNPEQLMHDLSTLSVLE